MNGVGRVNSKLFISFKFLQKCVLGSSQISADFALEVQEKYLKINRELLEITWKSRNFVPPVDFCNTQIHIKSSISVKVQQTNA